MMPVSTFIAPYGPCLNTAELHPSWFDVRGFELLVPAQVPLRAAVLVLYLYLRVPQ